MTCEVISTGGSNGNAVLLNGCLLFDCGVPFGKLKPYLKQIRIVFLTHLHKDHFNPSTVSRLHRARPGVRFVCSSNVLTDLVCVARVPLNSITLIRPEDSPKIISNIEVTTFSLIHDIENVGYIVRITDSGFGDDGSAMYATDTHHIPISAPGLDLYMVESNYTKEGMERRIARKTELGQFCYESRVKESHMSLETVVEWLRANADPNKSEIVFLHGHVEREEATEDDPVDSSVFQSDPAPQNVEPCGGAEAYQ